MSLANYIRHILTLTVSPPRSTDPSQSTLEQRSQKQQQPKEDSSRKEATQGMAAHLHSGTYIPTSTIPKIQMSCAFATGTINGSGLTWLCIN